MIAHIFVSVIIAWFVLSIWKRRKFFFLSNKLPNDLWSFPLLGHGYLFIGSAEHRMKSFQALGRIALQNNGITKFWMGPRFFVTVADPDYSDTVLKMALEKDDVMKIARNLFGNGSIFAPVPIWRPRRKVIAPTFSPKNLNQFVEIFTEQSGIMIEQMQKASAKGAFSIWKYLTTYTMDSVCESALGVHSGSQQNHDEPFITAFEDHCRVSSHLVTQAPVVQSFFKYTPKFKDYLRDIFTMTSFVDKIINNKRKELAEKQENIKKDINSEKNINPRTFLELYIESSGQDKGFTNLELREETLVLLLAGTDTSAVGAAFTSLMLAKHPDIQEKVYKEIKEVFGDSKRPLTAEDLPKLKYLEMVIKESLRLYPPVPIIVRKVDKDFQLPNGLTLYRGTAVLINIWATHRNQKYWGKDADKFVPERFLEPTADHKRAFMPFSSGPRSCLGYQYAMMSMKTVMTALVRNYRLLPISANEDAEAPLRVKFDIMMKHVDNFTLRLQPRE